MDFSEGAGSLANGVFAAETLVGVAGGVDSECVDGAFAGVDCVAGSCFVSCGEAFADVASELVSLAEDS